MSAEIVLTYDPLLLPTAQHRAGLAGLLVVRRSLDMRSVGPLPGCEIDPTDGRVTVTLSSESLQTVFDDLYDAAWVERTGERQPAGKSFRDLRDVPPAANVDGAPASSEAKASKARFAWKVVEPKGGFYAPLDMPDGWRKLWREAVWGTLRGRPTTRIPFEERADGQSTKLAARTWKDLTDRRKGAERPTPFSEALYVGAQSVTADNVPFEGSARETLLLHFWPVVTLMGQARRTRLDHGQARDEDVGYVLAVPDVADVAWFVDDFMDLVPQLSGEMLGYRPRDAVLALPQEGALEYVRHLFALTQAHEQTRSTAFSVSGVETYLVAKRGNGFPILASGRVVADQGLAEQYESIRRYRTSMFRAQLIENLLRGVPWYRGFERVFAEHDRHLFAGDASAHFGRDVSRKFDVETGSRTWGGNTDA